MVSDCKKILPLLAEQLYRRRVYFYITIFLILWPLNIENYPPLLARMHLQRESFVKLAALFCSAFYFIAIFIRMISTGYIGRNTVWSSTPIKDTLRYDGPYQYLRHPIYAGSLIIFCSLAPMCSPYGATFLILFGGGLTFFLARYEETILEEHDIQYRNRMSSIPRFIPRRGFLRFLIHEIVPTINNWRVTIVAERYNLAFGTGFLCFSLSFQKNAFWLGFIISFVLLSGVTFFLRNNQKPPYTA